ncbi:MAG: MBOAT family protein, partial [Lachnospiraceae bacterium]|nr:MBOAT family protein [Lachnospiraceae bacterium]
FRDYLYFPLGGSRKGKVRKYVNIMIVFLLSGLWHGAGWHFVFWGGMHGILRVLEEVCTPFYEKHLAKWFHDSFAARTVKRIVVFLFVTAAWVAFRASSIRQTFDLWKSMLKPFNPWVLVDRSLYGLGLDEKDFRVLVLAILFMILVDLAIHWKKSLSDAILAQPLWLRWLVLYVGIAAVLIFGIYGAEYNAAEFIYFQF